MSIIFRTRQSLIQRRHGFTIVELLIVIVVIGILAAITIVAFNGVQNKAKQAWAQSAVAQASKKIIAYAVQNTDQYPVDLATAGVADSQGLEYSYNNTSSPRTYGVTATNGTFSYYMSNVITQPTTGGYAGHSANGVSAITNLVTNPSAESNGTGWYVGSGGGTATIGRLTSGAAASGSAYVRSTWTAAATTEVASAQCFPVEGGKVYSARVSARPSWAGALMRLQIQWSLTGGTYVWNSSSSTAATQNAWNERTLTATSPATAYTACLQSSFVSGTKPAVGDMLDGDAYILAEYPSTLNFADGSSANWAWTGTANNSTSVGVPL